MVASVSRDFGPRLLHILTSLAVFIGMGIGIGSPEQNASGAESERPKQYNRRPNIVLILVDDLGYGDLSCYGAKDLQSPHIDALAARGMTFTNFYANCPVCSPTRAALLTGCYPELVGVPGVIRTHADNSWGYLRPNATLLPQRLAEAGYRTAIIGKWHLGLESPNTPTERGFEHFHGFLGDMMDDYYHHRRHDINYLRLNTEMIDPTGHATDLFTQWACDYLREASTNKPFFLYLAYNAPHSPIQPPEDWLKRVKERQPNISDKRARLVALIEHLDDGIGRVLKTLAETGLDKNTLVVFTSDNGGDLNHAATNGPLRDGKGSMYEGGLKVPACAVWPGHIAAGSRTDFPAMTMDLFPTLLAAVGTDVSGVGFEDRRATGEEPTRRRSAIREGEAPAEPLRSNDSRTVRLCGSLALPDEKTDGSNSRAIDGVSFLPTLLGQSQKPLREEWFFQRREGGMEYGGKTIEAVRKGDWKLLQNSPFGPLELYNLRDDPLESKNLIDTERRPAAELAAAMRRHIQRTGAVPWQRGNQ